MSPFIDVYRVEHAVDRVGPFTDAYGYDYTTLDAHDMPTVYGDVLVDELADTVNVDAGSLSTFRRLPGMSSDNEWRFAFPSIEIMRNWMSVLDRKQLSRHGFVVRTYRAPRGAVLIRREQVTFDPSLAVEVGEDTLV